MNLRDEDVAPPPVTGTRGSGLARYRKLPVSESVKFPNLRLRDENRVTSPEVRSLAGPSLLFHFVCLLMSFRAQASCPGTVEDEEVMYSGNPLYSGVA